MNELNDDEIFLPNLHRRDVYKTTMDGNYYSNYGEYRQEIREDCWGRCIYCDLHENELGGVQHMEIDHFRPQSSFTCDKNDVHNPINLMWSCRGCNNTKSNTWNSDEYGDPNIFIDPFENNRKEYFNVLDDGEFEAIRGEAQIIINVLKLNRKHRKKKRFARLNAYKTYQKLLRRRKMIADLDLPDAEKELIMGLQDDAEELCLTTLDFDLY